MTYRHDDILQLFGPNLSFSNGSARSLVRCTTAESETSVLPSKDAVSSDFAAKKTSFLSHEHHIKPKNMYQDSEQAKKLLDRDDDEIERIHSSTHHGGGALTTLLGQSRTFLSLVVLLLLILATIGGTALGLLIRLKFSLCRAGAPSSLRAPGLNEEINGLVPEFPRTTVLFWNDSRFAPTEHPVSEHEQYWQSLEKNWERLMPRGRGFIGVRNHEKYILPHPYPGPNVDEYGIAVFHQIHCLWLMTRTLKELGSGEEPTEDLKHVFHCADYLRLSLMCCGDTSLEGADPYHDPAAGTQGIGTTHVCKNYDAIFAWAEERRWTDDGTLVDDPETTL